MKIKRIRLRCLRNEEWFNFYTEFKSFVEEFFPQAQNIEALFATFLTLYTTVDDAMEIIVKSDFSIIIVQADERRDDTFRGLVTSVKANLYHYDENKRAAAERLNTLLEHYGNIAERPYNEETSAIHNFVQDLRGKYADAVQTLDLTGWVDELDKNNIDFKKAILDRNSEGANKMEIKLADVRKQTDRCYLNIVERFEALMLIQGDENFAPFVKTLNNNIERYNNVLKRRIRKPEKQDDAK